MVTYVKNKYLLCLDPRQTQVTLETALSHGVAAKIPLTIKECYKI